MTKIIFPVFLMALGLAVCLTNCSTSSKTSIPVGEVKVSYFAIVEGKVSKEVMTSYLGLVSPQWAKRYGRRLNEVFENIKPASIKVAPDKKIAELITLIQKNRFYSLKPTSFNQFKPSMIQDKSFRTKILTVEINGLSRSVLMNELKNQKDIQSFIKIKQAICRIFNEVNDPSIKIELGGWSDMFTPPPPAKPEK